MSIENIFCIEGRKSYKLRSHSNYYANGVWQIVSWGNDLTDVEIKEDHINDSHGPWY